MEGVLIAVISGLFTLTGIWLNYYLGARKEERTSGATEKPKIKRKSQVTPGIRQAKPVPINLTDEHSSESFIKTPSWWAMVFVAVGFSIGAALIAGFVIDYILFVFNIPIIRIENMWIILALGGLAWGIAYIIAGWSFAEEAWELLLMPFAGYEDVFDPYDVGDFLRGLLSALPINFIISWGLANTIGIFAMEVLGAVFPGVVLIAFSGFVFLGIVWFLLESI